MPKKENVSVLESASIRWGVTVLGGLILAGAVSLANRDVYTRAQVDEKIDVEREWSNVQDEMLLRTVKQQGVSIGKQLEMIREDQVEIKQIILKGGN